MNGCGRGEQFRGNLAFGVIEEDNEEIAWLVAEVVDGTCVGLRREVSELKPERPIDELLAVDVAISTAPPGWDRIREAGLGGFVEGVNENSFRLVGDLPFFIRHMEAILDVVVDISSEIAGGQE
jgi:hypothetical protein